MAILEKFLTQHEKITAIDCSIEQIISEKGKIEKLIGRYRANNKGNIRIDYTEPETQMVIVKDKRLLWYIPRDNTLFVIKEDNFNEKKIIQRFNIHTSLRNSFAPQYLGIWTLGLFTFAHYFVFHDVKSKMRLEMALATNDLRLLQKRICTEDGKEIMKEMYSGYCDIGDVQFPTRVDVYARTKDGYVRSITFYKNILLNIPLSDDIFLMKVPKKTRVLYYGEK